MFLTADVYAFRVAHWHAMTV